MHNNNGPLIGDGSGLTVITNVVLQPVSNVYVIVATPADIPPTIPVVSPTVAIPGALLVQWPPGVASNRNVEAPTQMLLTPLISAGNPFTVTFHVV